MRSARCALPSGAKGPRPGWAAAKRAPPAGVPTSCPKAHAATITAGLADAGVRPTLEVLAGDTGGWLHGLHRVKAGQDVFLVCNQNHQGAARRFKFRAAAAGEPECWDAVRNEITSIPFQRTGRKTVEFSLTLEPLETALIVFQSKGQPGRHASSQA